MSFYFPEAKVVGIDFASGMVEYARQKYPSLTIVQADAARLPFRKEIFDIVTSNLAYQWVEDLEQAFAFSFAALKKNGIFCFTIFGERTLEELFEAIDYALNDNPGGKKTQVKRVPSVIDTRSALSKAGFENISTELEMIKVHFENMSALLQWLKDIGANTVNHNVYIGKDALRRAEEYYNRNFHDRWGVYASFQVIWINSVKGGENREL